MTDKRRDTPSLLDQLSTGKAYQNPPEAPAKQNDSKAESGQDAKTKVTFYLPVGLELDIEDARAQLRRLTGKKITKSDIATAALMVVFADLAERGKESSIANLLANNT